jgi:competence protein ComGC
MNSNEKRWIVLLVAVVIIAIVFFVVMANINKRKDENSNTNNGTQQTADNTANEQYTTKLDDGTKINTSKDFAKAKTYNNLEISNIQFTEKDGLSTLLADVKNNGTTTHEPEIVKLTLLDENGNTVVELKPSIGTIEAGKTEQINCMVSADVTNVKDFKIEANQ